MTSFFSSLFSCKWNSKLCAWPWVACVASVSIWFRSKKRPWKGIFGFDRARNETRTKKWKRGEGEGKEGTADDSIKCRCVNRQAQTGQVGGFQNRGFYGRLSASVSSLSSPPLPRSFTFAIYRAVFDSCSSFFPPKPHRNVCYAG